MLIKAFKRNKTAQIKLRALLATGLFAAVMLVLGLYLILARDIETRAAEHVSLGAFYFAQSQSQGFEGPGAKTFLAKAKAEHLQALRMNPSDHRIWLNLSIILKLTEHQNAQQAKTIADTLKAEQSS